MYNPVHVVQFLKEKIAFHDKCSQAYLAKFAAHKAYKESGLFYRLFRLKWGPGFMDWIDWDGIYKRELEELLPKAEYHAKMGYKVMNGLENKSHLYKSEERFYRWCQENNIPS